MENKIIHLGIKTEFSFKEAYAHISEVIKNQENASHIGIADLNSTFGHFYLNEKLKGTKVKPIFGVRLMVVINPENKSIRNGQHGPIYTFIAKNNEGLKEIYQLVKTAYDNFYYRPLIGIEHVIAISKNVFVITNNYQIEERIDYIAINFTTSPEAILSNIPKVILIDNDYIDSQGREVYEVFVNANRKTFPGHILSYDECVFYFKNETAIKNTIKIASQCEAEFPIGKPPVYIGEKKFKKACKKGAKKRKINISKSPYKERFKREFDLIKKKQFVDYFLIVHDMISEAKKKMLVGPGRGSSGGSLICYLLGITELDPIKWDLLFDRFIDENRLDMPDIDTDFPDVKRYQVIDRLIEVNGREMVIGIGNVSNMKSHGAIAEFGKKLKIEQEDLDELKGSIITVSSGDIRSEQMKGKSLLYTFDESRVGKKFIEKYPEMKTAALIENHARHSSVHAAGVIISDEPMINFGSINSKNGTIQIEGYSAEKMGLLKMDCLGLSTLSVLEDIAEQANFNFSKYYELDFNDKNVYKIFQKRNLQGIFQFEGFALANLCRAIIATNIEDIVAITALARPGPLHSGGAARFAKIHQGKEQIKYVIDNPIVRNITDKTNGVIIYQEQVMKIMREVAGFPWAEVAMVRKIISKKKGKEDIEVFKEKFIDGSKKSGVSKEVAEEAWSKILEFAQYGFNRCLAGETLVRFAHPNQSIGKWISIEKLYEMHVENPTPELESKMRNQNFMPKLISLFPDGRAYPQRIKAFYKNGKKKCYKYKFENDAIITCTINHRFIINGEWKEIGEANIGDKFTIVEKEKQSSTKLISIEYVGEKETYDIEMEEHHNYAIDGNIITHNSHAVAYAIVSYWTAWAKTYYPLYFLAANLNHPKSELSSLRLIREMNKTHKFKLIPYHDKKSDDKWKVEGKKVIGPLTNIDGIGVKNAQVIMRKRKTGESFAPGIAKKLETPKTKFDIIYPCEHYWGDMYRNPSSYGMYMAPTPIEKVSEKGEYFIIGMLMKKNVRDLNEMQNVIKRGGDIYSENHYLLNITVEDDTGSIMARIGREDYNKIGKEIADEGREEKDWYLIKGNIINDEILFLFITEIFKLGDGYSDEQTIKDYRYN